MHMRLDAITACFSLTAKSQKSETLQEVHLILLEMPEFKAIRQWVAVSHIAGLGNVFADMASRPKKMHLKFKLAAVMEVELTKVETPTEWLESVLGRLLGRWQQVENGRREGIIRTPTVAPPPGQHADTPHMAALGEAEGNDKNKASFLVKRSECEKEEDARRRARILRAGSALHGGCIALKIEKQTAQHGAVTVMQARGVGARLGESGSRVEERELFQGRWM